MGLTLYKSSAGSGKTFTLVRLYLEKVIKYPNLFRNILAITFTNKATEEMKTRIIKELDTLSSGEISAHLNYLIEKTNLSENEIRINSRLVLLAILHDYSSFAVSTIDSYFQVLARTLARELHLPATYEIELDIDAICNEIGLQLLSEAGKDKLITDWLEELLLDKLDRGKSWSLKPELGIITKQILINNDANRQAINCKPEVVILLIQELKKIRTEVEETLRSIGEVAIASIESNNYSLESFSSGKLGAVNFFFKISKKTITSKNYEYGAKVINAIADPDNLITKPNKKDEKLVSIANEVIHPLLCQAVDFYSEHKLKYLSACEALKMIYLAGISGSLNEKIKHFRDEFHLFLLSDTTRMLREMVRDNDAPFMFEKTGNVYRHLFIDEFQDTSTEQWQILKPLLINSLGNGNDVLLVGDAKQSIYRFRGGNMHLLLSGVTKEFASFSSVTKELKLDTNYRSLENIVKFNNKFFKLAAQIISTKDHADTTLINQAYSEAEVTQHVKSIDAIGGFVELYFFDSPERKNKKNQNTSEEESQEKWKQKALNQLEITIEDAINNGYELRDITILVRTIAHEQEIASYLLAKQKYSFIASKSLLLSTNNQIQFILNCIRLLQNHKDEFLHCEINYFINEEVLKNKYDIPFTSDKQYRDVESWANEILIPKRKSLLALPIDLAYYQILQLSGLQKSDPFIDNFTDIVLSYISTNGAGIFEFLKWWDENIETKKWSVEIPHVTNAIRIITIHKSKGLQFPIVIIPFADWSIMPKPDSVLWAGSEAPPYNEIEKIPLKATSGLLNTVFAADYIAECKENYLDNLNSLYVAFTRAENQLHIFGSNKANRDNVGSLLLEALGSDEEWGQLIANDDLNHISIGELTTPKINNSEINKNTLYSPISKSPEEINISANKSAYIPKLRAHYESEQIIFGNYVHEILSQIKSKKDIPFAIHRLNVTEQLYSEQSLLAQLKHTTEQVWDLMELKGWNDASYLIKKEPDLCDENGASHRPDRVLIKNKKAIVIDFKTGVADEDYKDQVRAYCELIKNTGITETEGYLIYTTSNVIEQVLMAV